MFSWPSHLALVMYLTLLSSSLHRPGLGWGEQGMFWVTLCGMLWCLQRSLQEIQGQSSGTCKSSITHLNSVTHLHLYSIHACTYTQCKVLSVLLPLPPVPLFSSFSLLSQVHPNHQRSSQWKMKHFEFAGRLVGKCLYESAMGNPMLIKARFTRSFLAQLIGLRINHKVQSLCMPCYCMFFCCFCCSFNTKLIELVQVTWSTCTRWQASFSVPSPAYCLQYSKAHPTASDGELGGAWEGDQQQLAISRACNPPILTSTYSCLFPPFISLYIAV